MKVLLAVLILEIFILVLMVNGIEIVGKSLSFYAVLIINFILVIIMMLMLINTVLNVVLLYVFGSKKGG